MSPKKPIRAPLILLCMLLVWRPALGIKQSNFTIPKIRAKSKIAFHNLEAFVDASTVKDPKNFEILVKSGLGEIEKTTVFNERNEQILEGLPPKMATLMKSFVLRVTAQPEESTNHQKSGAGEEIALGLSELSETSFFTGYGHNRCFVSVLDVQTSGIGIHEIEQAPLSKSECSRAFTWLQPGMNQIYGVLTDSYDLVLKEAPQNINSTNWRSNSTGDHQKPKNGVLRMERRIAESISATKTPKMARKMLKLNQNLNQNSPKKSEKKQGNESMEASLSSRGLSQGEWDVTFTRIISIIPQKKAGTSLKFHSRNTGEAGYFGDLVLFNAAGNLGAQFFLIRYKKDEKLRLEEHNLLPLNLQIQVSNGLQGGKVDSISLSFDQNHAYSITTIFSGKPGNGQKLATFNKASTEDFVFNQIFAFEGDFGPGGTAGFLDLGDDLGPFQYFYMANTTQKSFTLCKTGRNVVSKSDIINKSNCKILTKIEYNLASDSFIESAEMFGALGMIRLVVKSRNEELFKKFIILNFENFLYNLIVLEIPGIRLVTYTQKGIYLVEKFSNKIIQTQITDAYKSLEISKDQVRDALLASVDSKEGSKTSKKPLNSPKRGLGDKGQNDEFLGDLMQASAVVLEYTDGESSGNLYLSFGYEFVDFFQDLKISRLNQAQSELTVFRSEVPDSMNQASFGCLGDAFEAKTSSNFEISIFTYSRVSSIFEFPGANFAGNLGDYGTHSSAQSSSSSNPPKIICKTEKVIFECIGSQLSTLTRIFTSTPSNQSQEGYLGASSSSQSFSTSVDLTSLGVSCFDLICFNSGLAVVKTSKSEESGGGEVSPTAVMVALSQPWSEASDYILRPLSSEDSQMIFSEAETGFSGVRKGKDGFEEESGRPEGSYQPAEGCFLGSDVVQNCGKNGIIFGLFCSQFGTRSQEPSENSINLESTAQKSFKTIISTNPRFLFFLSLSSCTLKINPPTYSFLTQKTPVSIEIASKVSQTTKKLNFSITAIRNPNLPTLFINQPFDPKSISKSPWIKFSDYFTLFSTGVAEGEVLLESTKKPKKGQNPAILMTATYDSRPYSARITQNTKTSKIEVMASLKTPAESDSFWVVDNHHYAAEIPLTPNNTSPKTTTSTTWTKLTLIPDSHRITQLALDPTNKVFLVALTSNPIGPDSNRKLFCFSTTGSMQGMELSFADKTIQASQIDRITLLGTSAPKPKNLVKIDQGEGMGGLQGSAIIKTHKGAIYRANFDCESSQISNAVSLYQPLMIYEAFSSPTVDYALIYDGTLFCLEAYDTKTKQTLDNNVHDLIVAIFGSIDPLERPKLTSMKLRFSDSEYRSFDLVYRLEDPFLYVLKGEMYFGTLLKSAKHFVRTDVISKSKYLLPVGSDSYECDSTNDFVFCFARTPKIQKIGSGQNSEVEAKNGVQLMEEGVNESKGSSTGVPEDENSSNFDIFTEESFLMVWPKSGSEYHKNITNAPYKIQKVESRRTRSIHLVTNYQNNEISFLSTNDQTEQLVDSVRLENELKLALTFPQTQQRSALSNSVLKIAQNPWIEKSKFNVTLFPSDFIKDFSKHRIPSKGLFHLLIGFTVLGIALLAISFKWLRNQKMSSSSLLTRWRRATQAADNYSSLIPGTQNAESVTGSINALQDQNGLMASLQSSTSPRESRELVSLGSRGTYLRKHLLNMEIVVEEEDSRISEADPENNSALLRKGYAVRALSAKSDYSRNFDTDSGIEKIDEKDKLEAFGSTPPQNGGRGALPLPVIGINLDDDQMEEITDSSGDGSGRQTIEQLLNSEEGDDYDEDFLDEMISELEIESSKKSNFADQLLAGEQSPLNPKKKAEESSSSEVREEEERSSAELKDSEVMSPESYNIVMKGTDEIKSMEEDGFSGLEAELAANQQEPGIRAEQQKGSQKESSTSQQGNSEREEELRGPDSSGTGRVRNSGPQRRETGSDEYLTSSNEKEEEEEEKREDEPKTSYDYDYDDDDGSGSDGSRGRRTIHFMGDNDLAEFIEGVEDPEREYQTEEESGRGLLAEPKPSEDENIRYSLQSLTSRSRSRIDTGALESFGMGQGYNLSSSNSPPEDEKGEGEDDGEVLLKDPELKKVTSAFNRRGTDRRQIIYFDRKTMSGFKQ